MLKQSRTSLLLSKTQRGLSSYVTSFQLRWTLKNYSSPRNGWSNLQTKQQSLYLFSPKFSRVSFQPMLLFLGKKSKTFLTLYSMVPTFSYFPMKLVWEPTQSMPQFYWPSLSLRLKTSTTTSKRTKKCVTKPSQTKSLQRLRSFAQLPLLLHSKIMWICIWQSPRLAR